MLHFTIHRFSGQKRKTRHRHIRTRSWPLGAAYAWLLDVSLTNAAIIFKDAENPTFINCNAKVAVVSELVQLLTANYTIPRLIPQLVGRRQPDVDRLTDQQIQEINVCCNRPLVHLDDAQLSTDRLDKSLPHFNRVFNVSGRCPLHTVRRRTNCHCVHCGVPLHHGLCHDVFHSVLDLRGVDLE